VQWLNGLKITPERLMDNTADEIITTGLSVPAGWTVSSFTGIRVHGITEVDIFMTRTGADITESSAGSGNITGDPVMCTLPSDWAPPRAVNATWGNGTTDGEATIVTSGDVQLRSISGSAGIATGTNVRITCMWISESPGRRVADVTTDVTTYTEAGLFWVTGAAGDGTSDDRWAIQAQLDAARDAGGGTVVIPAGKTYGVGTFLVVYDNTTIWAYGATIKAIGNSGILRNFTSSETFAGYAGHSRIQVLGGTWDGNAASGGVGTVTGMTNVMGWVHCSDITVRDATISNVSSAHACEFNSTDGGRVLNCRFEGFKDNSGDASRGFAEAVQIDLAKSGSSSIGLFDNTPSRNIVVQGCYFGPSSRLGTFGRAVGSHTTASGTYFENIQVIGNRINGAIQEGIHAYGWRRAVIADNIITGTGMAGIKVTGPDPATAGYTLLPDTPDIHGNVIDTNATESGIHVIGYATALIRGVTLQSNTVRSSGSIGLRAEYCTSPSITGNTVDATSSTGILVQGCTDAAVSGNTLRNTGSNAINFTASVGGSVTGNTVNGTSSNFGVFVGATGGVSSTDVLVSGNMVTAAASAGIRLSTGAVRCTVQGNKVRKGSGATVNGITLDASATACWIAGNDLSGNSWTAGVAIVASTAAPKLDFAGGTTSPGHNLI